jgi:hypothetical protein
MNKYYFRSRPSLGQGHIVSLGQAIYSEIKKIQPTLVISKSSGLSKISRLNVEINLLDF